MYTHFRNTALLTAAAITGLMISGCGSTGTSAPSTGTNAPASPGSSGSAPATTQPPRTPATTQAPTTPGTADLTAGLPAGYLPLFPFASLADVRAGRRAMSPAVISPGTAART